MRRLDPRPDETAIGRLYPDDYYSYAGRRRSPLKQRVWNLLRDLSGDAAGLPLASVPLRPLARLAAGHLFDVRVPLAAAASSRVLDVGCGYGDLLIYLQSRGFEAVGVELDERAAAAGRAHGIDVRVGGVADLDLPPESFDVAILQHSLEHFPDPAGVVAALARLVRPGGTLHVAVPNGASAGLRVQRDTWGCLFMPVHFWFFDEEALRRLLRDHGFEPTRVTYKTIWANHRYLWVAESRDLGRGAAMRDAARYLAALARGYGQGDILRLVARRVDSG